MSHIRAKRIYVGLQFRLPFWYVEQRFSNDRLSVTCVIWSDLSISCYGKTLGKDVSGIFLFFAFFLGGVDLQNVKPQWLPLLLLSDVWQTTPAPLLVWVWQHFSDRNTCKDLHINSKHVPSNLHVCKPALAHSHHPSPVMKSLTTTQLSENHWHTLRSRLKIFHIKHRKDCPCTFYATA